MGIPVVIKPSGGMPVTVSPYGTPMTEASNGFGIAVTEAPNGLPVAGITFGPTMELSASSVLETAPLFATVGILSLTPGTTGSPVYSLVDSAGGKFGLGGASLYVNAALDYETATFHNVTVAVSGVTPAVANRQFTILVTNVVEPVIGLTGTSVSEIAAVGTTVGTLVIVGSYTGTPAFTLTDSAGGKFTTTGALLKTNAALDYETASFHNVTVAVSGITPAAINATFSIAVADAVETVLTLIGSSVSEDAAIGTTVGTLSLINSYTGTPVYTLTDSAGGKFSITGTLLKVAAALDYETATMHDVTVAVSGITPAAADRLFTILVIDVEEVGGAEKVVTWDPLYDQGSGGATYSGDLLTAQGVDGSGSWNNAISTIAAPTGKYYFEARFTTPLGIPNWNILGLKVRDAGGSNLGSDPGGIGWGAGGIVLINVSTDVSPTTPVTLAQNQWGAIAFDADLQKMWIKNVTTGSYWNGNATDDPATGTGGITTPTKGWSYIPACSLGHGQGYHCQANFGATAYVGTPPAGFANWSASPHNVEWNIQDPGSGTATYSNGNMTATGVAVASTWNTVIASSGREISRRGKFYWEMRLDAATEIGNFKLGFCSRSFTSNNEIGKGGLSVGWSPTTGAVYQGGLNMAGAALVGAAVGHWIAFALDLTGKMYIRNITLGGTWNNNSADPVAGTGFYDLSSTAGATNERVAPCAQVGYGEAGTTVTANFGASAYQGTVPTGYINWANDVVSGSGGGIKTYNFVTDFGGVGDGVKVLANLTIPSGGNPNKLTANTALWDGDDVGKRIGMSTTNRFTDFDPGHPSGATTAFFGGTIVSIADGGTSVILSESFDNNSIGRNFTDMVNSPQYIEWSTDNNPMYESFRTAANAWLDTHPNDRIVIQFPPGRYALGLVYLGNYFPKFTFTGTDPANRPFITNCQGSYGGHGYPVQFGTNEGQSGAAGHSTRIQSVAAGATQFTVVPQDAAEFGPDTDTVAKCVNLFEVGKMAVITGIDLQGGTGYPLNPGIHQFLTVTGKNTTTGVVTFAEPLEFAYKDHWPHFNHKTPGGTPGMDYGGPATVYAFLPGWYVNQTYKDFILDCPNAYSGSCGHTLTFENVEFVPPSQGSTGGAHYNASCGTYPTMTYHWTARNIQGNDFVMEVDKLVGAAYFIDSDFDTIFQQSTGARNFYIDNCTVRVLLGTVWNTEVTNSHIVELRPAPAFFGNSHSLTVTDSIVEQFLPPNKYYAGISTEGVNNIAGIGVSTGPNGLIISFPKAYYKSHYANSLWGVVGCWYTFGDQNKFTSTPPGYWQILDIVEDATHVRYHTSCSLTAFPVWAYNTVLCIRPHIMPQVTFTNCSATAPAGTDDGSDAYLLSQAPDAAPLHSYHRKIMDNADLAEYRLTTMHGYLRTWKMTVNTAYAGATNPLTLKPVIVGSAGGLLNNSLVEVPYTSLCTVDLRDDGARELVVPDGATFPVSWTGDQGSPDVLPAITEPLWFYGGVFNNSNVNVSSELGTNPVSVTVEFTTDQGLP